MKLARFGAVGSERPGILLDDGTRVDVSVSSRDYDEAFSAATGSARWARGSPIAAARRRACRPARASARRWRGRARSSASG
jgi:hypothetical protein